jgi:hypothetical protein
MVSATAPVKSNYRQEIDGRASAATNWLAAARAAMDKIKRHSMGALNVPECSLIPPCFGESTQPVERKIYMEILFWGAGQISPCATLTANPSRFETAL